MGTLYIDRKDIHIRLDGNAIAFYSNGKREGVVPISPLRRVVIVGNKIIDTAVLRRLADENISVVFLSGKTMRFCGMLHGRLHNNGIIRLRQYKKSLSDFCIEVAREIVSRKLQKQVDFLMEAGNKRYNPTINVIVRIIRTIQEGNHSIDSLRGFEGRASAAYFSAYTELFADSLGFKNRNRRPPEDPVNAMLSLCYTMLHYELVREIEVIGLDPTIGFYHQFEYGRESLACDLVEVFRPDVDRFVYRLFKDNVFTLRDFAKNDERPGCYLKKTQRKRFYPLYEDWAGQMRPSWCQEVRDLARRIMDAEDPLSE
jgi:CRISPR-associated protein Cas1